MIENLEVYNRNWLSGYITVMYTTGPLFFSAMWIQYLRDLRGNTNAMDRIKVLVPRVMKGDSYGFFKNVQGGSWHGRETEFIFWMGRHWVLVTIVGFVIAFGVASVLWWLCKMFGEGCGGQRLDEKRRSHELWIEEGRYE